MPCTNIPTQTYTFTEAVLLPRTRNHTQPHEYRCAYVFVVSDCSPPPSLCPSSFPHSAYDDKHKHFAHPWTNISWGKEFPAKTSSYLQRYPSVMTHKKTGPGYRTKKKISRKWRRDWRWRVHTEMKMGSLSHRRVVFSCRLQTNKKKRLPPTIQKQKQTNKQSKQIPQTKQQINKQTKRVELTLRQQQHNSQHSGMSMYVNVLGRKREKKNDQKRQKSKKWLKEGDFSLFFFFWMPLLKTGTNDPWVLAFHRAR